MSFRLTVEVRDQAARLAKSRDRTLSQFAREALEARVEEWSREETLRLAEFRAMLRRRGPGIIDRLDEGYLDDDDGRR